MILSLSLWQWIKLIASFILYFSPGALLINFTGGGKKLSLPMCLILAFGSSLGFWILLLIWLDLFDISINSLFVRILFSLLFLFLFFRLFLIKEKILEWVKNKKNYPELLIIGFSLFIIILYLYYYRNLIAGMGSDSMHHTLISSLFIENGQIPDDYGPYAPVVTFSYHFGYHAYTAAMTLLSGIAPRLMVVISGAILMGLASLAGGALVHYLTKRTLLGVASAAIIGIIYVFPSYSLIWGRYTQLMGTIMLMIYLLALHFWDNEQEFSFNFSPILILITIGFIFSHYRIVIAGIIFTLILLVVRKNSLETLKQHVTQWLFIPFGALISSSPWLIKLFIARQDGYEAIGVVTKEGFFSLERLGPLFHSEVQTWILISLSVIAVIIGFIKKNRMILLVSLWTLVLGIVTQPALFGYIIDPVTTIISSYVPITILIGLGLTILLSKGLSNSSRWVIKSIILFVIFVGIILGVNRWNNYNFSRLTHVSSDDLTAANWIKSNTDPNSLFMINSYQFPINDNLIIGLDGGYWLPVIAERQTVVPPMIYQVEKLSNPEALNKTLLFHKLEGKLTAKENLTFLHENEVDYVYIGSRGGIINENSLIDSEYFELIYQKNHVSIYKILP